MKKQEASSALERAIDKFFELLTLLFIGMTARGG